MLAGCALVLISCGDGKKAGDKDTEESKAATEAETSPDAPRSTLAEACQEQTSAAEKANCMCRIGALQASLSVELFAKLETVSSAETTDDAVEHVGGMANLSKIYEAMRKAAEKCAKGAAQ